jgi:hypothetical protein
VNRTRVWLVVSPVVAAGVLTAHWLAYRLTSTPTEPFHGYLEHAPQVLLLLALAGVILAAVTARVDAPSTRVFPLVGLATFVLQEHLERLVHGGGVPFLLTSPAFLVGLALQIPVALVAWALARWLLAAVGVGRLRTPPRVRIVLARVVDPSSALAAIDVAIRSGRGPPELLLPSC